MLHILADSWQFANILKLGCDPTKAGACNATQAAAIDEYRLAMLTALAPLMQRTGAGYTLSASARCS